VPTRKPHRHQLDRRAEQLITVSGDNDHTELLTTDEVAEWFGVTPEWLRIGRVNKFGPPFLRIAPKKVRYRRADVLAWLDERKFNCTAEYKRKRVA
jgi:hypothetical protein